MADAKKAKPIEMVDLESKLDNVGDGLPTNCDEPAFYQRNVKGRDGDGPCSVINRSSMMPNGDIAPKGATFDPAVERMTRSTYQRLIALKRITAASKGVEDKMFKSEKVTKGKPTVAERDTSGGGDS